MEEKEEKVTSAGNGNGSGNTGLGSDKRQNFPTTSDINGRLRRLVTSYQRNNRKNDMRNEAKVRVSKCTYVCVCVCVCVFVDLIYSFCTSSNLI